MTPISKAIIDKVHFEALLSMAIQEGLIEIDNRKTDSVFDRFRSFQPSEDIKKSVLEQIVLTPNLFTTEFGLGEGVASGWIIDQGIISHIEKQPESDLVELKHFPLSLLVSMLNSRGYNLTENKCMEIIKKTEKIHKEEETYTKTTGKEPPDLFKRNFRNIFKQAGLEFDEQYSAKEYKAQEKRNKVYEKFKPLGDCALEYQQLATIAQNQNMLIKIPSPTSIYDQTDISYTNEETILFRIVAEELGRLTYRPTLRDTIKLAKEDITQELREQLSIWLQSLRNNDDISVEKIRKEIRKALDLLSKRHNAFTSPLVTYLGVPLGLVGLLGTLAAIPGLAVSIVGAVAIKKSTDIEEKHKWAMFGNN